MNSYGNWDAVGHTDAQQRAGVTLHWNSLSVDLSQYDSNELMSDLLTVKFQFHYRSKSNYNQWFVDELFIEMIDTCTIAIDTRFDPFDTNYQ